MAAVTYQEGTAELQKLPQYRDAIAHFYLEKYDRHPTDEEHSQPEPTIERLAMKELLRSLHAQHVEYLLRKPWK